MQLVNDIWNAMVAALADSAPWIVLGFLVAGLLHEFLPQGMLRRHLGGRGFTPLMKAVGFGALIPTCSCSTVPLGLGMVRSGAATGTALAFMTSAPTLSPIILVMGYSLLGPPLLVTYMCIVIVGAASLGWIGNRYLSRPGAAQVDELPSTCGCKKNPKSSPAKQNRLFCAARWALFDLGAETSGPLLLGLTIATIIMALVPAEWAARWLSQPSFYALAAAIALALPAYTCSVPSLLIAQSLLAKGASPGVAVAFMIAGPATNLGEILALRRGLGRRAAAFYATALVCLAFAGGVVTDRVVSPESIVSARQAAGSLYGHDHAHSHGGVFDELAAASPSPITVSAMHWHSVAPWQWPFVAVILGAIGIGMTRRFQRPLASIRARLTATASPSHSHSYTQLVGLRKRKGSR